MGTIRWSDVAKKKKKKKKFQLCIYNPLPHTLYRCVHTMPHSRMQHNGALPRGKTCSAYASKLITSTLKNNFLPTIFQFTKTMTLKLSTHHIPHQKLRLHYNRRQIFVQQTFDETNTLLIKFSCHVAICSKVVFTSDCISCK